MAISEITRRRKGTKDYPYYTFSIAEEEIIHRLLKRTELLIKNLYKT